MIDIAIRNMSKSYYSNELLKNINIELKKGEKVAILGDNGVGKTTIFKILIDEEPYNSGDIFKRKGLKIGLVNQEAPKYNNEKLVIDVLMEAFDNLINIKNKMHKLEKKMSMEIENSDTLLKDFGKLQHKYEMSGGYKISNNLSKITEGMKIDKNMQNKSFNFLSGGEKTRIMLAKMLLEKPDTLLLDEPTNHLDIEMIEWLENYLNDYNGSAIIISHDRYFLDNVIDKIYEIKSKKIDLYLGNFSFYLKESKKRFENQMKNFNNQKKKIKKMENAAKNMRSWASQADNKAMFVRAKAMEKRIDRIDLVDKPEIKSKINIKFKAKNRSGKEVIRIKNYDLKISNKILIKDFSLNLFYGEKAAIVGNNGTGKTTLLKEIFRFSKHDLEKFKISPSAKIGYLEQNLKFKSNNNILDTFKSIHSGLDGDIRNYLVKFKFFGDDVFKKTSCLSGGEKVRLKLAILMKKNINFLILDEPTNHIDLKTRDVLENALKEFDGTVLYISHDRYFLNEISDKIFEIESKKLKTYLGNYKYYKREKDKENKLNNKINSNVKSKTKKQYKNKINTTKKINKYKLRKIEENIKKLEIDIKKEEDFIKDHPSKY
ncbi:MAG: ribosomal protection-like ABC-F family protein, partial [Bacillota bacterium]